MGDTNPNNRGFLATIVGRVVHECRTAQTETYLCSIDQAMASIGPAQTEPSLLRGIAQDLGLTDREIQLAHDQWIRDVLTAAKHEPLAGPDWYAELLLAADLLDVDSHLIERRTIDQRTSSTLIDLCAGMTACFTGEATEEASGLSRETLVNHALDLGLHVQLAITPQGCDLLVATDTATVSSKAAKARRWGIPIIAADDFLQAEPGLPVAARTVVVQAPASTRPLEGKAMWCSPKCSEAARSMLVRAGADLVRRLSSEVFAVVIANGEEDDDAIRWADSIDMIVVTEAEAAAQIEAERARLRTNISTSTSTSTH